MQADLHASYEFGGPIGTAAMIIFFPCMMYYLYVCESDPPVPSVTFLPTLAPTGLWYFDGRLVGPSSFSVQGVTQWATEIADLARQVRHAVLFHRSVLNRDGPPARFSDAESHRHLPRSDELPAFPRLGHARREARRPAHLIAQRRHPHLQLCVPPVMTAVHQS